MCPSHEGVTIARVERDSSGGMSAVFWTRTLVGTNRVLGARAAGADDETRLSLDTVRNIPHVVTWCRRCRREWVLSWDGLRAAAASGGVISADGVLTSSPDVTA
jgi:hypothetical protein